MINIIFNRLLSALNAHGLVDWSATALDGSMKRRGYAVLADKAYSGHALRNELKRKGIKAIIPRKSNEKRALDGRLQLARDTYRNRNVVGRCFGRLKECRRIATRYDTSMMRRRLTTRSPSGSLAEACQCL